MPGAVLVVVAVGAPLRTLHAQRPPLGSVAPTTTELRAATALRLPPAAFQSDQPVLLEQLQQARAGRREGEILMIVGGAAILTGLLVDEGLITIAGAVVGGYGLYLYLREPRQRS